MSEEKKIEDLLKPRYKVIADYPGSEYGIGDVIYLDNENGECDEYFSRTDDGDMLEWQRHYKTYPNIFKPLEWWQHRKPEEMPKYVKETEATEYDTIVYYYKLGIDFKYIFNHHCIELTMKKDTRRIHLMYITPATESEYTTYLKQ